MTASSAAWRRSVPVHAGRILTAEIIGEAMRDFRRTRSPAALELRPRKEGDRHAARRRGLLPRADRAQPGV